MTEKKYTADDILNVDIEKHLLQNQEMYFGSRGANPEHIAASIAEGALILGARRTLVTERDGFWYICADLDWLEVPTVDGVNEELIFRTIWAFPEAGVNWHRSEVFARVFADQTFSVAGNNVHRIKGDLLDGEEIVKQAAALGDWKRVIGFRFNPMS